MESIATPPRAAKLPERMIRLARLCKALYQAAEGKPFFLGCRTASDFMGCGRTIAHGALQMLVRRGIIRIATDAEGRELKGTYKTGGDMDGKATYWEYIPAPAEHEAEPNDRVRVRASAADRAEDIAEPPEDKAEPRGRRLHLLTSQSGQIFDQVTTAEGAPGKVRW